MAATTQKEAPTHTGRGKSRKAGGRRQLKKCGGTHAAPREHMVLHTTAAPALDGRAAAAALQRMACCSIASTVTAPPVTSATRGIRPKGTPDSRHSETAAFVRDN